MIHRMYSVTFVALLALPAGAQERGVLAIDEDDGAARVLLRLGGRRLEYVRYHAVARL